MKTFTALALFGSLAVSFTVAQSPAIDSDLLGFRNTAAERKIESQFLAVPDPVLAGMHLRTLTEAPHMAGTPEDKATADYVAKKFREAGLETEIVEYRVWMNYPQEVSVDVTAPANVRMHGPSPERVAVDYNDPPFEPAAQSIHVMKINHGIP